MAILHLFNKFRLNSEPIRDTLKKIKSGDNLLKERLINDYKPFVIKVVSKTTGKHVELENSDEFSIGLIAFNEAIECYNESKNSNFFNFAEIVIKRRIIDYTRSNYKNNKVYPFTYFDNDENDGKNSFEEKYLKVDAALNLIISKLKKRSPNLQRDLMNLVYHLKIWLKVPLSIWIPKGYP